MFRQIIHVVRQPLKVAAILFAATFVRSALGSAGTRGGPAARVVMPVTVAVPIAALVSISVAAVVVVQDWRQVH